MLHYSIDHIESPGRKPRFWQPLGCFGWMLRVLLFLFLLAVFILLFCIPQRREQESEQDDEEQNTERDSLSVEIHEGDLEITLEWNTADDLDLHCVDPYGEKIYHGSKRSRSGGELDRDMNVGGGRDGRLAMEHIYWPINQVPEGNYKVSVKLYSKHSSVSPVPFKVRIQAKGNHTEIDTLIHKTVASGVVDIYNFTVR